MSGGDAPKSPPQLFGRGGDRLYGVGAYDVESAVDIGLLKLLHRHLHFHNA